MKFIADLHIHSHYSLATSKQLAPEYLAKWAKIKGIKVVGTGDFSHPSWLKELREKTEPAENGLFKLKQKFAINDELNSAPENEPRFILSAEISCIYKKNGKTRKVHNVVLSPDFETVEKIQKSLQKIGANITSDGRPIIGMDSRDLLELCLEASDKIFFIPAHIWTPWFSVLGSKSGFDSIEECYEDLAGNIYALETGLSSDAPMNRLCGILDKYVLLSNSDAHSPEKLGRNANIFDCAVDYFEMTNALKNGDNKKFTGTIDMHPEEGKYHYDGHRKCGICWHPEETIKRGRICSVCGKEVTVGVLNRVVELADKKVPGKRLGDFSCVHIIPLKEMLAEMLGAGVNSKKITASYNELIKANNTEFDILLNLPIEKISETAGTTGIRDAIKKMRAEEVEISHGYDGEYGKIKIK